MNPAPVIVFCYNRADHLRRTLEALAANPEAKDTRVVVYSDGPRGEEDAQSVAEVRRVLEGMTGFASVEINASSQNRGLAKSIIGGVTDVLASAPAAIILEDDIVVGPGFLRFMNNALQTYADDSRVWHITGWNHKIDASGLGDAFFYRMMNCWGWATWADRWHHFEKDPKGLIRAFSSKDIYRFNLDGAEPDYWQQVVNNATGRINTWAIFWYATIFRNDGLCLNPATTMVDNIGQDGSGTHSADLGIQEQVLFSDPGQLSLPTEIAEHPEALARIRALLERPRPIFRQRAKRALRKLLGRRFR